MSVGAPKVHSHIGASGAHRWMVCAGAPGMAKRAPEQASSVWADEGSNAHHVCEIALKENKPPSELLGQLLVRDGQEFEVTEEMVEGAELYVGEIKSRAKGMEERSGKAPMIYVEEEFDLGKLFPGLFGTNDAALVTTQELVIFDYKFGRGTIYEAEDSKQLLYYALGAIYKFRLTRLKTVTLVIVQPRAAHRDGPVRTWTVPVSYLIEFRDELIAAAKKTEDPMAPLVAGTHCKFCPAAGFCPEIKNLALRTAQADFADDVPAKRAEKGVRFPEPHEMSPEDLGKALELAETIDGWVRSVVAYAEESARRGRKVPGRKLVQKGSHRAWDNEDEAAKVFEPYGEVYKPAVLKSPSQVEKLLGKDKWLVGIFSHKPQAGLVLVPESDSREAVAPPILTDFDDLKPVDDLTDL